MKYFILTVSQIKLNQSLYHKTSVNKHKEVDNRKTDTNMDTLFTNTKSAFI